MSGCTYIDVILKIYKMIILMLDLFILISLLLF